MLRIRAGIPSFLGNNPARFASSIGECAGNCFFCAVFISALHFLRYIFLCWHQSLSKAYSGMSFCKYLLCLPSFLVEACRLRYKCSSTPVAAFSPKKDACHKSTRAAARRCGDMEPALRQLLRNRLQGYKIVHHHLLKWHGIMLCRSPDRYIFALHLRDHYHHLLRLFLTDFPISIPGEIGALAFRETG